jgi:hypothetical protein
VPAEGAAERACKEETRGTEEDVRRGAKEGRIKNISQRGVDYSNCGMI